MGILPEARAGSKSLPDLAGHLSGIARLAQPSPMVTIPAGSFLLGSKRVDDDPYGNWMQFDDTELPQHRVWLDTYEIDRDEVSLGEYLAFFQQRMLHPSDELQKLIWRVITIHFVADQILSRWPALYVTWAEAHDLCMAKDKRLPTEAEWVQDWFGFDYYAYMPQRNPPGQTSGRYKSVCGGSWKSHRIMLRTATRGGSSPDQCSATIGFRCANSLIPK